MGLVALALPASAAATTYTVTTTADSNDASCTPSLCSLRDAISHSVAGDKVVVPAGTYNLGSALPTITHDLTISGAGASSTSVAANATTFGVFSVAAGQNVSISGLTITGGKLVGPAVQGAGINTSGNLTLSGVVVTGNKVESASGGAPGGGGIEVAAGNLTLTSSQVTNNQSVTDSGAGTPEGAGIDDAGGGLVTISDSQINSNTSSITSGSGGTPKGGGIHDGSSGTMLISNSQIGQNTATSGSGSFPEGGGLANDGGGVVTISSSTINANAASTSAAGVSEGGGVANLGGSVTLTSTAVTGNLSVSVPPGGTPSAFGGGIYALAPLALTGSTVSGNSAIASTNGTARGGGLIVSAGAAIVNSTITGNSVSSTGTGTSQGGGVYNNSTSSRPLSVLNSTIDANSAPGGSGASAGGNVFTSTGAASSFENSILSTGSATTGPNCSGSGTLTSQGHNIESSTDCGFTASGDHQSTDPMLGSLQDNGGPTQTQAVQPGSPIIDAGNTTDCPATDQRGVARPQGSACDIGALEVEPPLATTGAATNISQTAATLNGTVTPNTLKAAAASYHFEYGTTTAYGSSTTSASTATGSGANAVSASLTGLSPSTTYHFRIVATNTDGGTATGADQTVTTSPPPPPGPQISALSETHRIFAVGAAVTLLSGTTARAGHPRGTVFSFVLNVAATVKVRIMAQLPGRQVGRNCKPPSRGNQRRPRCTRQVLKGTLMRGGHAGTNRLPFTGRLPRGVLPLGRYQAVFTAGNSAGTSGPQTIPFTIVKR